MREHNDNCRPAVLWHALMASWLSASDQSHVHVAEADLDRPAHSNDNSSAQLSWRSERLTAAGYVVENAQRVRLVLGLGRIAQVLHRSHDAGFVRITLAGQIPRPCSDRHAGVGNTVVLSPRPRIAAPHRPRQRGRVRPTRPTPSLRVTPLSAIRADARGEAPVFVSRGCVPFANLGPRARGETPICSCGRAARPPLGGSIFR